MSRLVVTASIALIGIAAITAGVKRHTTEASAAALPPGSEIAFTAPPGWTCDKTGALNFHCRKDAAVEGPTLCVPTCNGHDAYPMTRVPRQ